MRLVHLADTHLGYSAYRKITDAGINQRELDVYAAFKKTVDDIIKIQPDIVLHAGDLFDSVRPTNRAITTALQQFIRLSKAKIPVVIISGNHETPKLRETGNILQILDHLDHIYPIYKGQYKTLSFKLDSQEVLIHAIPQCINKHIFDDNIKQLQPNPSADLNVFVAHGAVAEIKEFSMNEFNELMIPVNHVKDDFDYIALGHYHNYTRVYENVYYAGSTERLSFSEANNEKGYILVDFDKKSRYKFIEIPTRPMIDVPNIDCAHHTIDEIITSIKKTLTTIEPSDKIVRIQLNNISSEVYRGIDFSEIRSLCKTATHCEIKTNVLQHGENTIAKSQKIESLAIEYQKFLNTLELADKKLIFNLGLEYINRIEIRDEKT